MEYRWMLVNNFIDAFNDYRASNYSPSDRICGMDWEDTGLMLGFLIMWQWSKNLKMDVKSKTHVMEGAG